MVKRVYWQTMYKWALGLGLSGIAGFTLLFLYLSMLGAIVVTDHTGDMICAGTIEDPCYAIINFTAKEDIFIYPMDYDPWGRDTPFYTDKALKEWHIYRSWGSGWREINLRNPCTATWCGAPPNSPNNKYAFAFREDRDYTILIKAYKENPKETIKWGFGPVDPFWYGSEEVTSMILELGSNVLLTANLTDVDRVCVDVDHPDYGEKYQCGEDNVSFNFNISYFRKTEFNDSTTIKNITWYDGGNNTVYIEAHQYDEIDNLTINITGFEVNDTYPESVKLYINDSLSNNLGTVLGSETLTTFSDGNASKIFNFTSTSLQIRTDTFRLLSTASVSNARVDVQGVSSFDYYWDYYDNINDSSLDTDLWYAFTYGNAQTRTTGENDEFLYANVSETRTGPYSGGATVQSIDLANLTEIENITLRVSLRAYRENVAGDQDGDLCAATLRTFGTNIKTMTRGKNLPGTVSDDSVWTFAKDGSDFDVYDDGVYLTTVTPTDNIIWINASVNLEASSIPDQEAESHIYYVNYSYKQHPLDPLIEVGYYDNSPEWSYSGIFNDSERTDNFNSSIMAFLNDCTADSEGYCNVTIYVGSENPGNINISNIDIDYVNNPNPITLNSTLIEHFLGNSSGFADIPLVFSASTNGTLRIEDIRFDYAGGNDTINIFAFEGFKGNQNNETLDSSADVGESSSIALDSNSIIHISYIDYSNSYLKYCNSTNGWDCVVINDSISGVDYTSMAIDSTDIVHVSFKGSGNLNYGNNTGGNWNFQTLESTAGDTTIAIDKSDKVHIAHYTGDLRYCNNTQGSWSCTAIETSFDVGENPSIAIDSNDYVHISYYQDTGENLKYCNNTQGPWSCTTIESSGRVGVSTSLAIDSTDVVHIAHYDYDNADLRYCNNTGGAWGCKAIDTVGDVGRWCSIAIDLNDDVHVVHRDSDANSRRYCHNIDESWSCFELEANANLGYLMDRTIAIKEGRIVDTSQDSAYIHTSWHGSSDDLIYTNISIEYSNKSNNDSMNITLYYSDWEFDYPSYVSFLEFIPNSPTSQNVSPYGQTSRTPIFNMTTTNYGGKNMNLTIKLNETFSCVNLTYSNDSSKSNGTLINETWKDINLDLGYESNVQVSLWADYNCSYSNWTLWYPELYVRGCCIDCICSEDT